MRNFSPGILIVFLLLSSFLFLSAGTASGQTPGLIYKPATNGGNKILDPNGDGYVSKTKSGFLGENMDEGSENSELPYKPFPVFMDEPLSDLGTGAKFGHTDFAPKGTASSPLAAHFDGTNFLFRVRLGGQSTASKGYSILIDANNKLTSTGKNPGFEYEIVLCTNFDVRVYYHGDNTNANPVVDAAGPIIFNGSVDQYSQKAIAASNGGGDDDYFYDFYIPLSALSGAIVPVTASTPLRMTGVTVTSARSGLFGTASDVGGVDDTKYSGNITAALQDIINSYVPTTPTGIQTGGFTQVKAKAPVVNGPITKISGYNTLITGYSVEAAGSVITVYQNGTVIGTTTVLANGTWSLSVPATTLIIDRFITATVKPTNKTISDLSNAVKVQQSPCFNTAPPVITGTPEANKGLKGTTSVTGLIKIYEASNPTVVLFSGIVTAGNAWVAYWGNSGGSLENGTYFATVTVDNCESSASNQLCYQAGNGVGNSTIIITDAPSISPASITSTSATIQVTGPAGSTLTLTKNGVQIGSATLGTSPNTTSTVWTVALSGLANGDVLYARATSSTACSAISGRSNAATVTIASTPVQSAAPVITGNYCGTTSTITGTSSEAPGTTIKLYSGTSTTAFATTTVNAYGSWVASGFSLAGGTVIRATATASGKTESSASASKTIGSSYTGTLPAITTSPVTEGDTQLKGTAPASSVITLYINGEPYVNTDGTPITVTSNSAGVWEYSSLTSPSTAISPFELYAGAQLTVKARISGSSCESSPSPAVEVQCKAPAQATTSLSQSIYCPGVPAVVKLVKSEINVIYDIYIRTASQTDAQAVLFSNSVLGTGKEISLSSFPLTEADNGKVMFVRTVKVGANCPFKIGGNLQVSVYGAVPNNFKLTASPASVCANNTSIITVADAVKDYTYQLINNATKAKIGAPVVLIANGTFGFPAVQVPADTEYSIIITRTDGGCVAENTNLNKVMVTTTGPTVNQAVTPSAAVICTGVSVVFSLASQSGYTYSLIDKSTNSTVGSSIAGTGNSITFNTGPFNTVGVRKYQIRVSNATCTSFLTTEPSVTVTDEALVPVYAGANQSVCGTTVTLQGSDPAPGTGKWTKISGTGGSITNDNSATTTVTGLTSGTYVYKWTVTTSCGSSVIKSSEVTITVNCAATYSVGTTKFYDEYRAGDVLATFSDDSDGGVVNYSILSGYRPYGSEFSIENGKLILKTTSVPLTGGDFMFSIRTIDARGVTTDMPVIIRMYNRNQAPGGVTPFPVELVYFKAAVKQKLVMLTWKTASEKDNDRFEIQRSTDGKTFQAIGTVQGHGNSSKLIKYSYTDTAPLTGLSYYRLKQIDYDGEAAYTRLESVKVQGLREGELYLVEAYPNPFTAELSMTATASSSGTAQVTVIDLQGKPVYNTSIKMEAGTNSYRLNLTSLGRGIYVLRVSGNGINSSTKLVKAQ